ncbi:MAG: acyl-CoA dehydrogenase family protein [Acidobacteriota bacterium]|nr:acyl-CoA dehydrogenase family protein [Acidobacteriota bacterium]MDE3043344.1 acyl-CoA dehydrogenase family protein [Acidobacteriota bacterium]MDE3106649.1 acyl-CoA dehydrogenase family protein [Acidobacteriota bacterium]
MALSEAQLDDRINELVTNFPPGSTPPMVFLGEQFDQGLAWVHFPEGAGGLNGSPADQLYVLRRLSRLGAPTAAGRNVIGYGMVAPTIVIHGTDEQKQRFLRPLFTGEEIWCQLFSEPGAGSDVATLATRAERDGDEWILTGQKVWTTLAHESAFGLLIARSNPDVAKHKGITAFLVDMHAPGVEVRPLYQATGEAEFNECFFNEVRVPDSRRLGGVGEGWSVSITTLMNERVSIGGTVPPRGSGLIGEAVKIWHDRWADRRDAHAMAVRGELMEAWVRNEVGRLTNWRASDLRRAGTPGPEGSVAKLAFAEENQRTSELCVDLLGADGMLYASNYPQVRPTESAMTGGDMRKAFIRMRANSIEGGTSEVMRNIIGERVLGLPGEPRNDKDVAWKDVPRS